MDDRSWQTWLTLFERLGRIEKAVEETRRDMPALKDKVVTLTASTENITAKMDLIILWGRRVPYILAVLGLIIANMTPNEIRDLAKAVFFKLLG